MILIWQIFKRAFRLTWQNKKLWLFGVLGLWLGTAGEPSLIVKSFNLTNTRLAFYSIADFISGFFSAISFSGLKNLILNQPASFLKMAVILLFLLAISVALVIFIVISQGALIYGVAHVDGGRKFSIKASIIFIRKKFWPLLFLNLLDLAAVYAIFLGLSLLINKSNLLFVFIFDLALIAALVISLTIKFASCEIVLKNSRFWPAFRNGFVLFRNNFFSSIKLSLFIFALYIAVTIAFVVLALVVLVPFFFIASITLLFQFIAGFFFNAALSLLLVIFAGLISISFFSTFYWSAWTLFYIKLELSKRE